MHLQLLRVGSSKEGTFGLLRIGQVPFAVTLEDPWRDNIPEQSCIPPGLYACKRVQSPRFGETFEVTGVPNRTHILFHAGNTIGDTEGCILIGEAYAGLGIAYSKAGFQEFLDTLKGETSFALHIVNHFADAHPLGGTTEV